ncbi:MAG: glycosyltransferase family 39 protein [Propionibacteriaceae bacterium]
MSTRTLTRDRLVAKEVHPFAGRRVAAVTALVAVAHLVVSLRDGFYFDEAYMVAIGRNHLDWGSADQPPVAPLLAGAMDALAPEADWLVHLPAVLTTAAAVVLAALIARELGGDGRAQLLAAGAQATALWITLAGHWLTPYSLEPMQWLVIIFLLVRWIRIRDDRVLLWLGVAAGIAANTKFQVLLLCAVLLITVAVAGPRDLLRRPLLWAGVGIAAVITAPTLIWQAVHGWPQLKMGSIAAAEAEFLYGGRPGVAVSLLLMAGVAGTVLVGYGLWRLLRAPEFRSYRFLALTFLVLYLFFVITVGRPYYLGGLYGAVAAAGAVGLQRRREAGKRRATWVVWPAYALSLVAAAGMLSASAPMVDPTVAREIVGRVATVHESLPAADREDAVIMGQSYILAAYADVYAEEYGLPSAHSSNRGYGYFDPPTDDQDVVVYFGSDPDELRPYFNSIERAADGGEDASVWICRGMEQPWQEVWPELRNLEVE